MGGVAYMTEEREVRKKAGGWSPMYRKKNRKNLLCSVDLSGREMLNRMKGKRNSSSLSIGAFQSGWISSITCVLYVQRPVSLSTSI